MIDKTQLARLRDFSGRALTLFASITLFVIMWLTVVDVFFRDAFNISITGLFEVTEVLMGILVFSGVPIITSKNGHVSVTIMDTLVGRRLRAIQKVIVNLVCVVVLSVFAWQLWVVAGDLAEYNDVTLFARIPLSPICYFMAVMTFISIPIQFGLMFLSDNRLEDLRSQTA